MLRLMHPTGALPWRYQLLDFMRIGVPRVFDAAVYATAAHSTATMSATAANRVEISTTGGASWTMLGTDVTVGLDLGAFTPGQSKTIKVRVTVPTGPSREELIGIDFGEGA
jgi:hypothetical protein